MMKMVVYSLIITIVYLVVMDVVNKQMNTLEFNNQPIVNQSQSNSYLTVTVEGAVNNPGTYTAIKGESLAYLVTLAGGLKENADSSAFNLSVSLKDNTTYYIPAIDKEIEKVSINTANIALLDTLPGIGNVLAKRIVSYRSSNGEFKSLEEIKNVDGIGESLFEQIKDLISL